MKLLDLKSKREWRTDNEIWLKTLGKFAHEDLEIGGRDIFNGAEYK